ncbi:MAG: GNAT family N-acetyltransferase [Anaerolineaceae bacterium]|nr:MAG: GNAT family N-acetyltransferase [Anaerolineaceae bacterium]
MNSIEIQTVRTTREKRIFLTFPWRIYHDDPLWVPPLIPERAKAIDPQRGSFFKRGEADFFVAWRDGEPVGTICAAEDPPTNAKRGKQECVFGFFEYIDDQEVAGTLVQRVIHWAKDRGLNALFGPFNLDYEDSYGVLLEGRDRPPALLCGHSPSYYQHFMDEFGFQPARGDNLAFEIDPSAPGLPRLTRLAEKLRVRGRISVRGSDLTQFDAEVDRVHYLLNTSLAHLPDHIGWHRDAVEATLSQFRAIADPELVLFAEVSGEPVGWLAGIPNLNEAIIRANGLRRPWDYLKLWWFMRRQPECLALKSVVVLPEYWNRGVAVVLFDEMARRAMAKGYKWADLSLTSADNPNTPILAEHMGAKIYKRYRVYRLHI